MKTMLLNTFGEDATFEVNVVEKPENKAGHVLVKGSASTVSTAGTMVRKMGKGLPRSPDRPAILAMDFAGTVQVIGHRVQGCLVGDEVDGSAGGLAGVGSAGDGKSDGQAGC